MIDDRVKQSIKSSVLCWLATVDESGQPHVSPKEIFAAFDERHLVVAHIASPHTVRNIASNPKVCLSFVDVFVQKGFKIQGSAQVVQSNHMDYAKWAEPLVQMIAGKFKISSVIVVEIQRVDPILAPSYQFYPGETTEQNQIEAAMQRYGVKPRD
jgi:predicted pyridoxine 5'-phosphate oxidase superfamily flavin-nucleotide-binding protein